MLFTIQNHFANRKNVHNHSNGLLLLELTICPFIQKDRILKVTRNWTAVDQSQMVARPLTVIFTLNLTARKSACYDTEIVMTIPGLISEF